MVFEWGIIFTYLGAGLFAGFMGGLLGIGGGVITVPVMFSLFNYMGLAPGWHMHMAVGTSLAIIIFSNGSAAWAHFKRASVDIAFVRSIGVVVAISALLGSLFASSLKTEELVYFFAGLVALLALKMFLPLKKARLDSSLPRGLAGYPVPALIGFFSAIVGIGGGSMTVPYMTLFGVPIQRAIGTSSLLGIMISLAGGAGFLLSGLSVEALPAYSLGFVHLPSLIVLAGAAVLAAPAGAWAAHKVPPAALRVVFGTFLLVAVYRLLTSL